MYFHLAEMGSEPLEAEEADEVIQEISFDENGFISQQGQPKYFRFHFYN